MQKNLSAIYKSWAPPDLFNPFDIIKKVHLFPNVTTPGSWDAFIEFVESFQATFILTREQVRLLIDKGRFLSAYYSSPQQSSGFQDTVITRVMPVENIQDYVVHHARRSDILNYACALNFLESQKIFPFLSIHKYRDRMNDAVAAAIVKEKERLASVKPSARQG
jgi:hypothetical protein